MLFSYSTSRRGIIWMMVIALLATWLMPVPQACADEMTDGLVDNEAFSKLLKAFGSVTFEWRLPAERRARDKTEFQQDFWASATDAKLTPAEMKNASDRFDQIWGELLETAKRYDISHVSFVGCDCFSLEHCYDLYYSASTPRGPIVFKFSVEVRVGSNARLFGMEAITGWASVKSTLKAIEHQVALTRVPTITCPEQESAATQP